MEVGRVGGCECREGPGDYYASRWSAVVSAGKGRETTTPPVGRRSTALTAGPKTFLRRKNWRLIVPPVGRQSDVGLTRPNNVLDTRRPSHGSGASSAQNLSASDLVIFRSLPPRKDRNTDELRQASLRSQSRRARRTRVTTIISSNYPGHRIPGNQWRGFKVAEDTPGNRSTQRTENAR